MSAIIGPEDAALPNANIFDQTNRAIHDFIHKPENQRLKPGTGSYSTLFHGRLFGAARSCEATELLPARGVDVLWLGTNPNIPRSLAYILAPPEGPGDFPTFQRQMASGLLGARRWDANGEPSEGWSPVERPEGNWHIYRDALQAAAVRMDCVAMANFVPWGSESFDALLNGVAGHDAGLLSRILDFSNGLLRSIFAALEPKVVVVPFSLGRNRAVKSDVSISRATDVQKHAIDLTGQRFRTRTAQCVIGGRAVPAVFLRHPSSLRVSVEDKARIVEHVAAVLRPLLAEAPH